MRLVLTPAFAIAGALALADPAAGDESEAAAARGTGFDFYVMSLSWSPTYCLAQGGSANRMQCGKDVDFAFIAHGLWPQYESGYPEYCQSSEPERVPDRLVDAVIDIMPSAGLVGHQWRKHGSCTGLTQADYLKATREAFERVVIPPAFAGADEPASTSASAAEAAFIAVNPGLEAEGIAVSCKSGRLAEVRICLTKELSFRDCAEVDSRGCSAGTLAVPQAP